MELTEKVGDRERDLRNHPSDTYQGEGIEDAAEKAKKLILVISSCSPMGKKV